LTSRVSQARDFISVFKTDLHFDSDVFGRSTEILLLQNSRVKNLINLESQGGFMNWKQGIFGVVGLTVLLVACPTQPDPPTLTSVSGQISNWNNPPATLGKIEFRTTPLPGSSNSTGNNIVGSGSIDGQGNFTVALSTPVAADLQPLPTISCASGAINISNNPKFTFINGAQIPRNSSNLIPGSVILATSKNFDAVGEKSATLIYSDTNTDITGSCTNSQSGVSFTSNYNVQFRIGWNWSVTTRTTTEFNITSEVPTSDLKWIMSISTISAPVVSSISVTGLTALSFGAPPATIGAIVLDANGVFISPQPAIQWSLEPSNTTGIGTLSASTTSTVNYTPPASGSSSISVVIRATVGNISGTKTITVSPAQADSTPPKIQSTTATGSTSVDVFFDEALAPATVTAARFSISGSTLAVTAASLSSNGKTVTLTTGTQTANAAYAVLVSSSVTDLAGNAYPGNDVTSSVTSFSGFDSSGTIISGQISNWNSASPLDKIEFKVNTSILGSSNIDSLGNFKAVLSTPKASDLILVPASSGTPMGCASGSLIVSNSYKTNVNTIFNLKSNSHPIILTTSYPLVIGGKIAVLNYSDANVDITGSCSGGTSISYNIHLKIGWNWVIQTFTSNNSISSSSEIPSSDMKWILQ
jgi:hypothetical protein